MTKKRIADVLLIILFLISVILEFGKFEFSQDSTINNLIYMTLSRMVASLFFVILIVRSKYRILSRNVRRMLPTAVCFLVAINNFPIIPYAKGLCSVSAGAPEILLFAAECIAVASFEELAFRGLLFPLALEKRHGSRKEIFACLAITSCLFGLYHLVNLFEGAGIGPTIQQVGYSALIGAMCAACMLVSGNIIIPILIHATFNFCGTFVPTLGDGIIWDTPTIIITVVLSIIVFAYMLVLFIKIDNFTLIEENFNEK